ncbi:MAG: transcriptional repressor [Candidatus Eremiobacter antarcticus]|nr:transcriptional repressor [Candidatus Eremiobacteraeota bacterium]MBC5807944.1 transcriptional repressor [Candidatus Eremiobacteraeota bacterium]PZR62690.1 MAG: transcriptional repressor [Candidatus Eremiobacter sp. RRmetagenome_bin22]
MKAQTSAGRRVQGNDARKRGNVDAAYRALAGTNRRLTKQRRVILAQLARLKRYVTAQELHSRMARSRAPGGLATVYRTLEALRGLGMVTTSSHGDQTTYLLCDSAHHHHAVCIKCGRVDEVPCRSGSNLQRALLRGLRFRLTQHEMKFLGVCARCS